ncbi:heme o synthase [Picrophilus oshimae]|uniref:Protoheme IX farnesyltransferase n=1 Tax=Picrophilus torridus (strain ATCC 700027 / DSM 9790 / JCM 10055 / NBRC 100828 / KAW 2/3) TaxID=1122961 RepID=A0A8G2FX18_PICTO|nr:heme o synthase [Picrophilus oshimae]SMD31036.1 protoheme IX farnesyltransferase [Picrophilus oshimae DSM 9789]
MSMASQIMKITKLEITILIDIVAIAAFLAVPGSTNHIYDLLILIFAGTLASMSASIFNNIYDMDIDPKMKRTSSRSQILNANTRSLFFIIATAMVLLSFVTSFILLNPVTSAFILGGFASYVLLYTIILKRRTSLNIVIGGIAGSFPALAGWASITGSVSATSLFIAFLVFMWTPTHFWNLSVNNVDDYKKSNIPMLPAVVGIKRTEFWIMVNTSILVIYSILPLFIKEIHVGLLYMPMAAVMDALLIYYVARPMINNYNKKDFKKAFHFSNMYMLMLLIGIMLILVKF